MADLLTHILAHRSEDSPDKEAFIFLEDGEDVKFSISYKSLWSKVLSNASGLFDLGVHQKTVLLMYPPGIEYIEAFLSCLTAGAIAVPIYPPRSSKHTDRLKFILEDTGATTILTDLKQKEKLRGFDSSSVAECDVLCLSDLIPNEAFDYRKYQHEDAIAFLQYTSGSTGDPKGVIVTNGNLIANEEQIQNAIVQDQNSVIVSWLPMYHDMGLIGNILFNIYIGSKCVFFAPVHFLQSPIRWLRAITEYKATLTGAPNFAFDLLNKLDIEDEKINMSSVEVFFNGAEKVRFDTLDEFSKKYSKYNLNPKVIYPCYGLAEATLMIAGPNKFSAVNTIRTSLEKVKANKLEQIATGEIVLVSSGKVRDKVEIKILDENGEECTQNEIGTIFISGPNVSQGYWNSRGKELIQEIGGQTFINTGDHGTIVENDLYITGRSKEIIIKNGVNYYPYDLERLVSNSSINLAENGCAVVSFDDGNSENLIVIAEIKRSHYRTYEEALVYQYINEALSREYGFVADDIVLISPMSIPKTSSGKIQRTECLRLYENDELSTLSCWSNYLRESQISEPSVFIPIEEASNDKFAYLKQEVNGTLGIRDELSLSTVLCDIGLDSILLMRFSSIIEKAFNVQLNLNFLFGHFTTQELILEIEQQRDKTLETQEFEKKISTNAEALWLANENGLGRNKVGFAFKIVGENSFNRLNSALTQALLSLEWKKTNFTFDHGSVQRIEREGELFEELYFDTISNFQDKCERLLNEETKLEEDPLIHLLVAYDNSTNTTHVQLITHHIVSDGISLAILFNRWLCALKGEPIEKSAVNRIKTNSYEQKVLNNDEFVEKALSLFNKTVGSHSVNELQTTGNSSELKNHYRSFSWNKSKVLSVAKNLETSLFNLTLFLYQYALSYLNSCEHICTVTPFGNRVTGDSADQFDYLVNLMYLRSSFESNLSIRKSIQELNEQFRETLQYQSIDYAHLLREAKLPNDKIESLGLYYFAYQSFGQFKDFQKLFESNDQVILKIENGVNLMNSTQPKLKGNFKMELELFECANSISGALKFESSHFSEAFGMAVINIMNELLVQIEAGHEFLNELELSVSNLYKINQHSLKGNTKYIPENHFLELFKKSVDQFPERSAIVQNDKVISYKELDELSDQIAKSLVNTHGVKRDDCILISSEFNFQELAILIGIMKAGGVYVPVNEFSPKKRIEAIARDAKANYLIGNLELDSCSSLNPNELFNSKIEGEFTSDWSKTAYLIYTSGTSGLPKGVEINQIGLVNLCYSMKDVYAIKPSDRVLQFASLSFDMSVEETFPYWSSGATVVMRESNTIERLSGFIDICAKNQVSILNLPTSFWEETSEIDQFPKSIRIVAVGGEKMNDSAAINWLNKRGDNIQLFNAYGPTEYTVNATIKELNQTNKSVSVGTPILNTEVVIVNSHNQPLPQGVVGELVLKGKGLANGYINRTSYSGSAFIEMGGDKAYCTGDLAYINNERELVILGRKDSQVKVRGYRVEISAIKGLIEEQKNVVRSAVILKDGRLIAFVKVSNQDFDMDQSERELRERLPVYAIPSQMIILDEIPLTLHGKVDTSRLEMLMSQQNQELIQPKSQLEVELIKIWKAILCVDDIGVMNNFFELGGHSIKAIKLLSVVETELDKKVRLKILYENPTIRGLANYIETVDWIHSKLDSSGEKQDEILI